MDSMKQEAADRAHTFRRDVFSLMVRVLSRRRREDAKYHMFVELFPVIHRDAIALVEGLRRTGDLPPPLIDVEAPPIFVPEAIDVDFEPREVVEPRIIHEAVGRLREARRAERREKEKEKKE